MNESQIHNVQVGLVVMAVWGAASWAAQRVARIPKIVKRRRAARREQRQDTELAAYHERRRSDPYFETQERVREWASR